jgi:hypothetical protein
MSLTTKDIQHFETIVLNIVKKQIDSLRQEMHEEFMSLKDDVAGIRKELNTEHEIRRHHIEDNSKRISALEKTVFF